MQYYRTGLCVFSILMAIFFPPIVYLAISLIFTINYKLHPIEKISIYLSLAIATSFKIAFIDFYGSGVEDFHNYYSFYENTFFSNDKFIAQLDLFPHFSGYNLEVLLPFIFILLKFIFPFLLSPIQFAFALTFLMFSVYYYALYRLLLERDEFSNANGGLRLIFFIGLIGLSDVVFYQLIRQGFAGAFILLALTSTRTRGLLGYFFLATVTHVSTFMLLPLMLILRSKYGFGAIVFMALIPLLFYVAPDLISDLLRNFSRLDYYDFRFSGELLDGAFNYEQNTILLSLCALFYLVSRFASQSNTSILSGPSMDVGGSNSIIFFSLLFVVAGSVPLLFDRVALLYITLLIWIHIGCFSVALRKYYAPHILLFFLALWKFNYLIDSKFFYVHHKWFSFLVYHLFS